MTTPIVEITPVEPGNITYRVLIGPADYGFENGIANIPNSAFSAMCIEHVGPFKLDMESPNGANGIFHREPDVCVFKLASAMLYDISGDIPVEIADISDKIIISNDGRIVFKPNIVRVVNGFVTAGYVSNIADLGNNAIEITVEATPAYINPSAATPVYSPTVLKVKLALNGDLAGMPSISPVDFQPYIEYVATTMEQPAI